MGSRAYDLVWGTALRTTTRLHRLVDRLSGGRLGRRFPGGSQVVWISTLGRRSGEWRRNPLLAVREDGRPDAPWIVAGSNAGQEAVPAWVHNARANPDGRIEVDGVVSSARFEEVTGPERARLYAQLVAMWSGYAMYERNAGREIPVFRLHPLPNLPESG